MPDGCSRQTARQQALLLQQPWTAGRDCTAAMKAPPHSSNKHPQRQTPSISMARPRNCSKLVGTLRLLRSPRHPSPGAVGFHLCLIFSHTWSAAADGLAASEPTRTTTVHRCAEAGISTARACSYCSRQRACQNSRLGWGSRRVCWLRSRRSHTGALLTDIAAAGAAADRQCAGSQVPALSGQQAGPAAAGADRGCETASRWRRMCSTLCPLNCQSAH